MACPNQNCRVSLLPADFRVCCQPIVRKHTNDSQVRSAIKHSALEPGVVTGTGPAPGGWGGNHGWPPASSPEHPPQYGWPPPPAEPRRSRWPWIAAAVTACVVIVIGSVFFLPGSHGGGADSLSWDAGKDDGKVAGTYPSQPQPGWSVPLRNVTDLADYSWGYAADYGDVVLITAEPSYGSDDKSLLVALETASGRILWTTPSGIRGTFNCARETVDNLLMCVRDLTDESHEGAREVQFYRLDTGELASTQTLPGLVDATVSGPTTEVSDDVTVGIDPATGVVKWRLDDAGYCFVNDGTRCISDFYDGSKSVRAYNLNTGETDWSIYDVDEVSLAGPGFVTVDQDPGREPRVTYYPPPQ